MSNQLPDKIQKIETKRPISPVLLARLGYLMDPAHLESFVSACEIARDAGSGFATVEIAFAHYEVKTIQAQFSVKPKCD